MATWTGPQRVWAALPVTVLEPEPLAGAVPAVAVEPLLGAVPLPAAGAVVAATAGVGVLVR
jgi:hypothetical protein